MHVARRCRAVQVVLLAAALTGAGFVALPALLQEEALGCGEGVACVPLAPGEASLRVAEGASYEFLDATGAALARGCGGAPVDVPAGAVLLRVHVEHGACR
jgi:hypothetical protein